MSEKCRWCNAEFTHWDNLESHEELHAELDFLGGEDVFNKECKWCHVPFTDVQSLHHHERTHRHEVQSEETTNDCPPEKRRRIDSSPQPGLSHIDNRINQFQTGRGENDENSLEYEFKKIGEKTFNTRVIDRHYQVKFNPNQAMQGQKLSNIHDQLENMFDDVVGGAKEHLKDNDLGRVIIHHDKLVNPIFVPLRPLAELNGKTIMDHVENVLTSHQDLAVDENFYFDAGTMELPKGGRGISINNLIGPNNHITTKQSIIEICNQDNTCLARAILLEFLKTNQVTTQDWKKITSHDKDVPIEDLVLKYKVCPVWYFKKLLREDCQYRQTDLTMKFCHMAHANTFSWLSINDIPLFERILDVDVLVVSARMGNKFLRVPPEDSSKQRLYVYLVDDSHFHAIENICGFFGSAKFCEKCLKPYQKCHSCEISCLVCKQKGCTVDITNQVSCKNAIKRVDRTSVLKDI